MDEQAVRYERRGGVGVITLARPDNRNSMTPELLDAFAAASAAARADADSRAVVVTGEGRCFSAGADFKSQIQRDEGGQTRLGHERSYAMYAPFLSLLDIEVPTIAALNGHAVGGGFGLSLACDLRIGVREAKYGALFTRLGLHPGMAISWLLPRVVGVQRAAELLFTGRLFDGDEGLRYGYLLEAVDATEVMSRAMALAETIAANAPLAMRLTKTTFYEGLNWRPREAALREAYAQAATVDTDDAREGMAALLDKRAPDFKGR